MPPGDGTRVRPVDLVTHAGHVDAVADQVAIAQQAGVTVGMDAGAYGRLCTIVPLLLGRLQDLVIDGMASAKDSLHDTGQRLRVAAEGYQVTDAKATATLGRLRGAL